MTRGMVSSCEPTNLSEENEFDATQAFAEFQDGFNSHLRTMEGAFCSNEVRMMKTGGDEQLTSPWEIMTPGR